MIFRKFNISKLFQQLKHTDTPLTEDEKIRVRSHLNSPFAHLNIDTHTFIYVFVLSHDPTDENVSLIDRFLEDDTDEYVKRAALTCSIRYWNRVWDMDDILIKRVNNYSDLDDFEFLLGVFSTVFDVIFHTRNTELAEAVSNRMKYYQTHQKNLSERQLRDFRILCECLCISYTRNVREQVSLVLLDNEEDILEVAKLSDDLLDEMLNSEGENEH